MEDLLNGTNYAMQYDAMYCTVHGTDYAMHCIAKALLYRINYAMQYNAMYSTLTLQYKAKALLCRINYAMQCMAKDA